MQHVCCCLTSSYQRPLPAMRPSHPSHAAPCFAVGKCSSHNTWQAGRRLTSAPSPQHIQAHHLQVTHELYLMTPLIQIA